jgi:hypothetical protein
MNNGAVAGCQRSREINVAGLQNTPQAFRRGHPSLFWLERNKT